MYPRCAMCCVLLVLLTAAPSVAQVVSAPTPSPMVFANGHDWYEDGFAIRYAGDLYYPAGAQFHFDANVMVQSGDYDGVPIYVDTSVTPYSQILLPIEGGLVQPYERRRAGALAGTTGSHAPSFPVEAAPGVDTGSPQRHAPRDTDRLRPGPSDSERGRRRVRDEGEEEAMRRSLEQPGHIETILKPEDNRGIWIRYEGQRWAIAGNAVPFDPARHSKIGEYHGFPVYAARGVDEIFIPATPGMVSVYRKDSEK